MKSYGLPLLVVGGGGYTIRNVARCWTYETAQLLDAEISDQLPYNDYLEYYGPDFRLHIEPSNMENQNNKEYLDKHLVQLLENIRHIEHAPSVAPFHRPPDHFTANQDHVEEDQDNEPDTRMHASEEDKKTYNEKELYDPDDKRRDPQRDTDFDELFSKRQTQQDTAQPMEVDSATPSSTTNPPSGTSENNRTGTEEDGYTPSSEPAAFDSSTPPPVTSSTTGTASSNAPDSMEMWVYPLQIVWSMALPVLFLKSAQQHELLHFTVK